MNDPSLYHHLGSKALEVVDLHNTHRIRFIRSGVWVGYVRAKEILSRMEDLLEHPPVERMPNMLLIGSTNNGKTQILQRFESLHPMDPNPQGDRIRCPVLRVNAPATPDISGFCIRILQKLGAPYRATGTPEDRIAAVIKIVGGLDTRILLIDEIQHMLTGSATKQREFRNAIKEIGTGLKIPIVAAGIEEASTVFATDAQLSNRFPIEELPLWKLDSDLGRLLLSFERLIPLRKPSGLQKPELVQKVFFMSEGLIGEIYTVLTMAAIRAIELGQECITLEILNGLRWKKPSERKMRPAFA